MLQEGGSGKRQPQITKLLAEETAYPSAALPDVPAPPLSSARFLTFKSRAVRASLRSGSRQSVDRGT